LVVKTPTASIERPTSVGTVLQNRADA
jgi:hypothetical protein